MGLCLASILSPAEVLVLPEKFLERFKAVLARMKLFGPDVQDIILDDLLTAWENRIAVFDKHTTCH